MRDIKLAAVFFFTFHCKPVRAEDVAQFGGANINCWTGNGDYAEAERKAGDCIANIPWFILWLEDGGAVTCDNYETASAGKN